MLIIKVLKNPTSQQSAIHNPFTTPYVPIYVFYCFTSENVWFHSHIPMRDESTLIQRINSEISLSVLVINKTLIINTLRASPLFQPKPKSSSK